jgi:hypothetical protein
MATFSCKIPNLNISVSVNDIRLIENCLSISYSRNILSAVIKDGLTDEEYEKISKQVRLVYGFCFDEVYPESYDVREPTTSLSVGGHDERKEHLLEYSGNPRDEFKVISTSLFKDLLKLELNEKEKRQLFNLLFVWVRAHELEELKLMVEAYTQYWRVLDLIEAKGSRSEALIILKTLKLDESLSNIAAAKIELVMKPSSKEYSKENIETISYLDRLRHPHAHKPSRSDDYYLEEISTHLDAEINNIFIADITKLYIVWIAGLKYYYLKPRANIYELAKRDSIEA